MVVEGIEGEGCWFADILDTSSVESLYSSCRVCVDEDNHIDNASAVSENSSTSDI